MDTFKNPVPAVTERLKLPNAAWSWEVLRRNPDYIRDYNALTHFMPAPVILNTGGYLIREMRYCAIANKWGLLFMANPALNAIDANVFWNPNVFPAALPVVLKPITPEIERTKGRGILNLQTRRVIFDALDGTRHILLCGERFWIQLYCENCELIGENAMIESTINIVDGAQRKLDTAAQLLSLYKNAGGKLNLIGRNYKSSKLADAIIALDVKSKNGSYRDIAIALEGEDSVQKHWRSTGCRQKDHAKTTLRRGQIYIAGKYLDLLGKKSI